MALTDILSLDCTQCAVQGSSKKRVLETISHIAHAKVPALSEQQLLSSLVAREKMGSTGIGGGIAIPHGRLEGIDKPIAVLVTCSEPIAYDAIDDKPVDVLFALLVPEGDAEAHLSTLSSVAKTLSDSGRLQRMRQATTNQQLYDAANSTDVIA